jgi:REP element-mobilizing transposase RayT
MSNKPRIEVPGGLYHVNANAAQSLALYRDEFDRIAFLELVMDECVRSDWSVLAYALMTTHYHVLIRIKKATLSSGFQRLQSLYARRYNRRHKRRGVVWQARFHDELIDSEGHLYETIRYIALNPTRAQMCEKPEDWPWSSYGAAIGAHPSDVLIDETELLPLFGTRASRARSELRRYVEEKDPRVRRSQRRL